MRSREFGVTNENEEGENGGGLFNAVAACTVRDGLR